MAKKIKIKTHSGAKKRFNISKNGKVKYQKTNRRHRLTQKATKSVSTVLQDTATRRTLQKLRSSYLTNKN